MKLNEISPVMTLDPLTEILSDLHGESLIVKLVHLLQIQSPAAAAGSKVPSANIKTQPVMTHCKSVYILHPVCVDICHLAPCFMRSYVNIRYQASNNKVNKMCYKNAQLY